MKKVLPPICIILTALVFSVLSYFPSYTKHGYIGVNPQVRRAYRASVSIHILEKGETEFTEVGSAGGTVVGCTRNGRAQILTNRHVLEKADPENRLLAVRINGTIDIARPLKRGTRVDLALVETIGSVRCSHFISIARESPCIGDFAWLIGSPGGVPLTVSNGIISNKIKVRNTSSYMITASSYYGSSGGGLFNINEELIGVFFLVRYHGPFQAPIDGGGAAVSLEEVQKFLSPR